MLKPIPSVHLTLQIFSPFHACFLNFFPNSHIKPNSPSKQSKHFRLNYCSPTKTHRKKLITFTKKKEKHLVRGHFFSHQFKVVLFALLLQHDKLYCSLLSLLFPHYLMNAMLRASLSSSQFINGKTTCVCVCVSLVSLKRHFIVIVLRNAEALTYVIMCVVVVRLLKFRNIIFIYRVVYTQISI